MGLFRKKKSGCFSKVLIFILAVFLCFGLVLCGLDDEDYGEYDDSEDTGFLDFLLEDDDCEDFSDEDELDFLDFLFEEDYDPGELIGHSGDPNQTWAIYWYLCGSDLESENGAATDDLYEMLAAELPENVKVIIETGGAMSWMNDMVDDSRIERYVYSSEGLELVDRQRNANMGSADTLSDFLSFCRDNYPADRTMLIFWDHGGGSVSGAVFDENYYYDSLTLDEFYSAFDSVYDLSRRERPLDIVGFDACLMATVDVAYTFSDIADYLIASEEFEPGVGWEYSRWLTELSNDPGMDAPRLGQHICESYMDGCGWFDGESTLSVIDLSRLEPLLAAYENMGIEALNYALDDPFFLSSFARKAENSENYGGNTSDMGYSNLVDLGDLARNCRHILPQTSEAVLKALERCVVYNVKGDYRENASGLSCYYSYNGDLEDFWGYQQMGCSDSFKYLYDYCLEGELPPEGLEFIESIGYEEDEIPQVPDLLDYDGEYPLYFDDEDLVVLELPEDVLNMLKGVYFKLAYVDEEDDLILYLGRDNDIDENWEEGIFRDNFRGTWGAIDGHLVYMEVYYECDDYSAFSVPVLLNDREYSLRVIYDYEDEEFYIMGARRGLDDNGMADKNLVQLRPGDKITTIHYASSISGDDDFVPVPVDSFTVTDKTAFSETDMGDGTFLMCFELLDAKNNAAYSQMVQFDVRGDFMDIQLID